MTSDNHTPDDATCALPDRSRCPDFLIIGAAKAGTTALWSWLKQCPEVFLPTVKEPHYFCFAGRPVPHQGEELDCHFLASLTTTQTDYLNLFQGAAPGQLRGEASTGYLYHPGTAERIAEANPAMRIICVLRNPVARAFSQFLHHLRDGFEPLHGFADALAAEPARMAEGWWWGHHYFTAGLYAAQWRAYCKVFPPSQRLLLLHDDIEADPQASFDRIISFIGLEKRALQAPMARENVTQGLRAVPRFGALHRALHHGNGASRLLHTYLPQQLLKPMKAGIEMLNSEATPKMPCHLAADLAARYRPDLHLLEQDTGLSLAAWTN